MTGHHGFLECKQCRGLLKGSACRNGVDIWGEGQELRLENNPAVWGARDPEIYLLGFSKGEKQNIEVAKVRAGQSRFDDIPFKGMRHRLGWLLEALGLLDAPSVDSLFDTSEPRVRSASLVRCSLSAAIGAQGYSYKMKSILQADPALLQQISVTCVRTHLSDAHPGSLFVLLGLDSSYIRLCTRVMGEVFGPVKELSSTTYRAGPMWIVHVAHPSGNQTDAQYRRWVNGETKAKKVKLAREAVDQARKNRDRQ